jgi:hypothetical protein
LGLLPLLVCAYLNLNIFNDINSCKMSSDIKVQRICPHRGKELQPEPALPCIVGMIALNGLIR